MKEQIDFLRTLNSRCIDILDIYMEVWKFDINHYTPISKYTDKFKGVRFINSDIVIFFCFDGSWDVKTTDYVYKELKFPLKYLSISLDSIKSSEIEKLVKHREQKRREREYTEMQEFTKAKDIYFKLKDKYEK